MRDHQKRYLIEAAPALALYALAIWISAACAHVAMPTWEHMLVALSPLPALVWTVIALLRRLLRKDEFEQRIELIAIAIAAASVGLASFAWARLQSAALVPRGALMWVLPALVLVYGVVKLAARWHYR
jgi:hypothetical protein